MEPTRLHSGRLVHNIWVGPDGRPKLYEIFDTSSGARRNWYGPFWDGRDMSRTRGPAASEEDIPELIEHFMARQQTWWRRDSRNQNLIWMDLAFLWLRPTAGDQLEGKDGNLYTVLHVGDPVGRLPWNGALLLDQAPDDDEILRWAGEAAKRNLIDFVAEDGVQDVPVEGEPTTSDVGTGYRGILRPTITHLLVRQEPYTLQGNRFGPSKELKPREHEQLYDPANPQRSIRVWVHRMDNLFKFLCIHPRAQAATSLARWFKSFINRYTPSLKYNGISEMLFWDHRAVPRDRRIGDDAAVRQIQYYFGTEEIRTEEVSTIRGLPLQVEVLTTENRPPMDVQGWPGLQPFTGMWNETGGYRWGSLSVNESETGS